MNMRFAAALTALVAALGFDHPAHAINHASEYKTNMANYRTCTDPLLDACGYVDALSPSKFYLASGTTTTVVHKDDGTVQLRIDSGGLLTDTGLNYACAEQLYPCVGGKCVGGHNHGFTCTPNRCDGGPNDEAPCNGQPDCPEGTCSDGSACSAFACQGGARDDLECSYAGNPACTSVAGTSGWSIVFRGNNAGWQYLPPSWRFLLRGDDDDGCIKACSFALNANGAINSNGLTCSTTGTCGGVEAFHYVELRDPDGEIVAIPGTGPAMIVPGYLAVEGDPAQVGDCGRPSNAAKCP